MALVIKEAIRLRKADEKPIEVHSDNSQQRKERNRSASSGSPPGTVNEKAPAASNGSMDVAGPEIRNQEADASDAGEDQEGSNGDL